MASGLHVMAQQRAGVEARIKMLVNPDLKEICKAYGYQVSGTKAVLQKRCLEILNELVKRGDANAFQIFSFRVNNHGRPPPLAEPALAPQKYQTNSSAQPAASRTVPGSNRLPGRGKYFKESPFYEVIDTVLSLTELQAGQEMPQNRHTIRPVITLDENLVTCIKSQGMRLLLYCGPMNQMSPYNPVDIAFPSQIEIKINNDTQQHNYKGLKNKPGTTKPVDITDLVRVQKNYTNQLSITYALTPTKYAVVVHLARVISADTLTERVKTGNVIPKDRVLADMRRANDDADITATSVKTSLKDPVSTLRISLPVRSSACAHNQCFDAGMFLQMMAQAPTWSCPICNKPISFESLCVDKYFQDILDRTSRSIDKVNIEPNGEWTVIKEEEDAMPNSSTSRPRAAYDDDYDDEVIEVADVAGRRTSSTKPLLPMSNGVKPFAMNTPPLSSREASVAQSSTSHSLQRNKRPAEAVIDLTLDDSDEDQPPRPAKRQTTKTTTTTTVAAARSPALPATPINNLSMNNFTYHNDHSRPLSSLANTSHLPSNLHDRSSPFLNADAFKGPHSPVQQSNGNSRDPTSFGMTRAFQPQQQPRSSSQYSQYQNFSAPVSLRPASTDSSSGLGTFSRPGPPSTDSSFGRMDLQRSGPLPPPPPPPAAPSSSQSDQAFRLAPFRTSWRNDFDSNSSSPG